MREDVVVDDGAALLARHRAPWHVVAGLVSEAVRALYEDGAP